MGLAAVRGWKPPGEVSRSQDRSRLFSVGEPGRADVPTGHRSRTHASRGSDARSPTGPSPAWVRGRPTRATEPGHAGVPTRRSRDETRRCGHAPHRVAAAPEVGMRIADRIVRHGSCTRRRRGCRRKAEVPARGSSGGPSSSALVDTSCAAASSSTLLLKEDVLVPDPSARVHEPHLVRTMSSITHAFGTDRRTRVFAANSQMAPVRFSFDS